ncbi:MAG TPA: exo-beta-N-acetylmuramidase NamZ domain-containing protein [Bryobacteraceae bacterium]|nr:exo-beta-N-acetylmuramidase NamZ domain-containing protein [Bryobacteraceae bacterium]
MKLLIAIVCAAAMYAQEPFSGAVSVDREIDRAVHDGLIPGAVVLVGHDGRVVYEKAYGSRAIVPRRELMTVDTIFDIASLTKVVATTPALMRLFEQGQIRLNDPVTKYLPEFQGGHSDITIRNLMTHFSGLRPDLDLQPAWTGYEHGIHRALIDKPTGPPGVRFVYSDINFNLLAEIVHRLTGKMLNEVAREIVFEPLGMKETMFLPPASLQPRIAPTEIDPATGQPLRGQVDDDTARYMGGVAGNAGAFSTAADLAKFAQMMLDHGEANGSTRLFSAATIEKFTTPQSPPDQPILRGLGWDIDSPYSSNRGELFPIGSYGHTGFTGTSIWIDPFSRTYLILLTNSVHPHRGHSIVSLRSRIATIVAASFGIIGPSVKLTGYNETIVGAGAHREAEPKSSGVLTGLDVLAADNFAELRGKRIGLITNQTGVSRDGRRNIDLMLAAGISITALFSPEHGLQGAEDRADVSDTKDPSTGLPVFSLYQASSRRIQPKMLDNVDALVFDIQDVGARFYTYSCTMLYAMEEAAKKHVPFFVLDRPNPITGVRMEGPLLDRELESFTGCFEIPVRHGMTLGELAEMANGERKLGADLHVVAMRGWERGEWFDATGLPWVDPSPNMRSLTEALLYPGIAMLETSPNYSVGRGTDSPFELIGADWIRGRDLAERLNSRYIPGVRVYPVRFRPTSSNFAGKTIEGVRFVITNRDTFDSVRLGLEVAHVLNQLYPGKIAWEENRYLIGNRSVLNQLKARVDPGTILQETEKSLAGFNQQRDHYLIYK